MRYKSKDSMEKIVKYVEDYAMANMGETPGIRDIGRAIGMSHVSVLRYLRSMDEIGMIRYENGKVSTGKTDKISFPGNASASFLSSVPAGIPEELENMAEEYVFIPEIFTGGRTGKFFVIRICGVSMTDAGIDDGDILIMEQTPDYHSGDIILALIDNECNTLKRVKKDTQGFYLWAENESWDDNERFYGRNFTCQGVAIKVVKDI